MLTRRYARSLSAKDLRVAAGDRHAEGNWGRKFWLTELLQLGLSSEDGTVFARHIDKGSEVGSSTQIESRWAIHRRIVAAQDGLLREMGVVAPRGLADGSADDFPLGSVHRCPHQGHQG